jgi:hypothetical protein
MNSMHSASLDAGTGWQAREGFGFIPAYYFLIGFYVAALISAAVSISIVLLSTWLRPDDFDWARLAASREVPS